MKTCREKQEEKSYGFEKKLAGILNTMVNNALVRGKSALVPCAVLAEKITLQRG